MTPLHERLIFGPVLLMDGAMGTEIQRRRHTANFEPGEALNLSDPELIASIHRDYIHAGAEVIVTNTFQTNDQPDIWRAALRLARRHQPRFVLADVGPIEHLTPEIVRGIVEATRDADGLLLETWTSFDALMLFGANRREAPLLVSFTFLRKDGVLTTFDGMSPDECALTAYDTGAVAIGANCGKDMTMLDMVEVFEGYRSACNLPLFARPNAGTPIQHGTAWTYPHTAEAMASELPALLDAGVVMVGGCCGTTPEYIRAFRDVIRGSV